MTTRITSSAATQLQKELFEACLNNNQESMQLLIEQKADPTVTYNIYSHYISPQDLSKCWYSIDIDNTLLHAAILSNSIEMINYVHTELNITSFSTIDRYGYDALQIALMKSNSNIIEYLINTCNILNNQSSDYFNQLLKLITTRNDTAILKYMIPYCIQTGDELPTTILRQIIQHASFDVIQFIYQHKYAVFDPNDDQLIPWASKNNSIELIDFVIKLGANIESKSSSGNLCVITAAKKYNWDILIHLIQTYKVQFDGDSTQIIGTSILSDPTMSPSLFDQFITLGFNINNMSRIPPIIVVALQGNFTLVKHLLENYGQTPNILHEGGTILYYLACAQKDSISIEIIDYFCTKDNFPINSRCRSDLYGGTILSCVISNGGNLDCVKKLISYGADIVEVIQLFNPLRHIRSHTNSNVIDYLLTTYHQLFSKNFLYESVNQSMVFGAVANCCLSILKLMIEFYGVSPTIQQSWDKKDSLQIILSTYNIPSQIRFEIVQYLLSTKKFNLNKIDNEGRNLFLIAIHSRVCNVDILQLLIQAGIKIGSIDYIMLKFIETRSDSIEVFNYLMSLGVNVEYKELSTEQTLLQMAIIKHSNIAIRFIAQYGAKIDIINRFGNTLLHLAADHHRLDVLNIMYECHPQITINMINKINNAGQTPLSLAVERSNWDIAKWLVQHGSNLLVFSHLKGTQTILVQMLYKSYYRGTHEDSGASIIETMLETIIDVGDVIF